MAEVQVGLPQELNSKLDYSVPSEVQSTDVRIYPTNIQSVQSSTISLGTTPAIIDIPLPTNTITFSLPAGAGKGQFLDHRFTRLNFRVNYEVVTASTGTTLRSSSYLRSSAHSWFQRVWSESQSGVVVSDQPNYDIVADMYNQFSYDVAQRDCNAVTNGFESTPASSATASDTYSINSNQGHIIPAYTVLTASPGATVQGNQYYSYSIPVLDCLVGEWARRFFQIGAVSRHTLNFQLPALAPITLNYSDAGTTGGSIRVTIDNISLSLRLINLPMDALKLAGKDKSIQYYNGITSRVASQSLGTTNGSQSWLIGIRGSSVKNLVARFTEQTYTTTGCINRQFDSKMPLYTSINYNVNGVNLPASPDDLVRNPAGAFARTQMAMAQFNSYDFKSGLVPSQYCRIVANGGNPSDLDQNCVRAGSGSTTNALCSFHYGVNLERISKAGILSGMNLNSSNTYLNVNSSVAPTQSVIAYFISLLDVLVIHDIDSGELSVRL